MERRIELRLVAVLVVAFSLLAHAGSGPRSLTVTRIDKPFRIDGKLDEPAWQDAALAKDFVILSTHAKPSARTVARVASDGSWLYIGVQCEEAAPADLVSRVKVRDQGVHNDDSIEIFLDPGTNGKKYFHFALNVANVQADQLVYQGQRRRNWNAGWRSAVLLNPDVIGSKGWSAEVAIPLYIFRPHQGKAEWRLNICRNKKTRPKEFSSWSPVDAGYHEPTNFGYAYGLKDIRVDDLFAPIILSGKVSPYRIVDGRYSYEVGGEVMNDGGMAGDLDLVVQDTPANQRPSETKTHLTLGPLQRKEFKVAVPIAQPGDRDITIVLRNPKTGDVLQQSSITGLEALNPVHAYLDRNYYTTEAAARVIASVASNSGEADLRLAAHMLDAEGRELASAKAPVQGVETLLALPIRDRRPGRYKVKVELATAQHAPLGAVVVDLVKQPTAPEGVNVVKIDQVNRCLLVNDRPFFPVGICQMFMGSEQLQLCKEAGLNCMIRWWGSGAKIESALSTLDMAFQQGLYMIDRPLCFTKKRRRRNELIADPSLMMKSVEETRDFFRAVRNHPALLMYYGLDEAPSGPIDGPLQKFLKLTHELDPYHPVYISGSQHAGANPHYDFADILGHHIYWCPMGYKGGDTPDCMAKAVHRFYAELSEKWHRPLFIIPQLEITSLARRAHTPAERRIDVYLAIIHGAKSIIYFAAPIRHRATLESVKRLSVELHGMAPALLTRRPRQTIRVTPPPAEDELPIVQAVVKDHLDGSMLLIAGNSSPLAVDAEWDLSSLGKVQVADFLEYRQPAIKIGKGILREHMAGYGTRVYKLTGGSRKPGQPLDISLKLTGDAVEALKHKPAPKPAPQAINLLANAGFEDKAASWTVSPAKHASYPPNDGRNGSACLKLTSTKPLHWPIRATYGRDLALKPNTRYRYGGWVKTKLKKGKGASFYVHEIAPKGSTSRIMSGRPLGPTYGKWQRVMREFATPGEPAVKLKFWFQVMPLTEGSVWLDDCFVEELPPAVKPKQPKNLVFNSSFEAAALPGWPDSWFIGATRFDSLIGDPGATGQDSSTAFHGKYSLEINNPYATRHGYARAWYRHKFASSGLRGGIPVQVGKTYTLSAYMRAEKAGASAGIMLCNMAFNAPCYKQGVTKRFKLTTDWKRYSVTCTYPKSGWTKGLRPDMTFFFFNWGIHCGVWVDAVQFEEGDAPTAYAPREAAP